MNTPKERILLVEYDPEVSDLISRQTLQPMGYRVEVVSGATQAIQEAVRFAPDVIIANLSLPGLSGKDLLVALSSQGLEVPVIVLAPKGMEGDVIQAFRLGAADFLGWPVREAEVVSAVERILKQVRARREREMLARQLNQTNQELQRRVRELTTIFAIGKAVISATDQQALFDKIVEGATFITEADAGWLLVRDERGKSFILRACRNVPNDMFAKLNQVFDDGLSSLVALSGEALSIHGDPLKRFKVVRIGQSALVVPVKVKKEVVGLLVVTRKEAHPFSNSQQALLEAVADYASISLVNARLFKALEERVNTLQQSADNAQVGERIKDEVLQQIREELSAPLLVIKGNADMLLGKEMGKLNTEQTNAVNVIQEKLKTILDIVAALTAMDASDSSKERSTINLTELTRQAINRFQPIARQNSAAITAELPSKPIMALADPGQISKVFDGLLSNAVKFSMPGARIKINLERSADNMAHVSVQDTGVGMDPQHLPHIFDEGYRIKGASGGRYGGVGISLSLVKEIVTSHRGKVWAESQPDQGSTFHFSLPSAGA
ncbi:MAG TPA: ATP-binding protein [Anaerolineales bacterium]|nr:ATP-binding protein [Anaerolineales bacterium]